MTHLDYAKPEPARRSWRRTVLILVGAFALATILVAGVGWILLSQSMSGTKVALLDFDPVKWQEAPKRDRSANSVRLRMADSFLAHRQPLGKSRSEIVALLGEPDNTPYFRNYDMVYYLGPERGPMGIDSEWLVLKLTNGSVTEARLATD